MKPGPSSLCRVLIIENSAFVFCVSDRERVAPSWPRNNASEAGELNSPARRTKNEETERKTNSCSSNEEAHT